MSICLAMQAITEEQAERLRAGDVSASELLNPIRDDDEIKVRPPLAVIGCATTTLLSIFGSGLIGSFFGARGVLILVFGGIGITFALYWVDQFLDYLDGRPPYPAEIPRKPSIPDEWEFSTYAWNELHYILCGETQGETMERSTYDGDSNRTGLNPLSFLIGTGEIVEDARTLIDRSYVAAIAKSLGHLTPAIIESRIASMPAEAIAPWNQDPDKQTIWREEVERLRTFVGNAANHQRSLLFAIE